MTLQPAEGYIFIYPFLGSLDGTTAGGLIIEHHRTLPPVLGLVLVSRDPELVGRIVVYRPHAYEVASASVGDIAVLPYSAIAGVFIE